MKKVFASLKRTTLTVLFFAMTLCGYSDTYYLWRGTSDQPSQAKYITSAEESGTTTTFTVTDLVKGTQYYFGVSTSKTDYTQMRYITDVKSSDGSVRCGTQEFDRYKWARAEVTETDMMIIFTRDESNAKNGTIDFIKKSFVITADKTTFTTLEEVTLTARGGTAPYIWEESTDGSTWTKLSGSDNTIKVYPFVSTYYRCSDSSSQDAKIQLTPSVSCNATSKKSLFKETFGQYGASGKYSADQIRAESKYVPSYKYISECLPIKNGGEYAIVTNPKWGGCGNQTSGDSGCDCTGEFWYRDVYDHTQGGEDKDGKLGGMLMLNCKDGTKDTDVLYQRDVEIRCPNTLLSVSLWVLAAWNPSRGNAPVDTKFILRETNSGKFLTESSIKNLDANAGWTQIQTSFLTEETKVTIQFVNCTSEGNGNDLLIDDIEFFACSPDAALYVADDLTAKQTSAEVVAPYNNGNHYDTVELEAVFGSSSLMTNPYYYWVKAESESSTEWTEVSGASGVGSAFKTYTVTSKDPGVYKVCIAPDRKSAVDKVNSGSNDPCGLATITNALTVKTDDIKVGMELPDDLCKDTEAKYTITVTNPFKYDISDVNVVLQVSADGAYSNSHIENLTTNVSEITATKHSDRYYSVLIKTLPAGGAVVFSYNATPTVYSENLENTAKAFIEYIRGQDKTKCTTNECMWNADFNDTPKASRAEDKRTIKRSCDNLSLALKLSSEAICSGATETLTFTITNNHGKNPSKATGIKVTLPTQLLEYVSCEGGTYDAASGVVSVGSIAAGASKTIKFVTKSKASGVGEITAELTTDPTIKANASITVNPLPKATIAVEGASQICVGSTTSIKITPSEGTPNYTVVYNDGLKDITLTGVTGTHVLNVTPGTTTTYALVSIKDTNGCSSEISGATTTLKVDEKPAGNAGADISQCNNGEFSMAATATTGNGVWSIETTSTNATIEDAGSPTTKVTGVDLNSTETLTWTVTNGVCDAVVSTVDLTNNDCTDLTVVLSNVNDICAGGDLNYSIVITNGSTVAANNVQVTYTKPDGTTASKTYSSIAAGASETITDKYSSTSSTTLATKSISVVAKKDGGSEISDSKTFKVNPLPEDQTLSASATAYCAGGSVTLSLDGSQSGITYTLYKADGSAATAASGTGSAIDFSGNYYADTYTVKAVNDATSCWSQMTSSVTVVENALPTVSVNITPNTRCEAPYNGSYTIIASGAAPYLYSNDGGITYSKTATYSGLQKVDEINARVIDGKGCESKTLTESLADESKPLTVFDVKSSATEYCANDEKSGVTITLSDSEVGVKYTLYKGTAEVSSKDGTGSELDFGTMQAGIYTVTAKNTNTGCSANMNGSITVTENPVPEATLSGTTSICSDNTSGVALTFNVTDYFDSYVVSYKNSNGDEATTSSASVTVYPTTSTSYYITSVKDANNCERIYSTTTADITADITVDAAPVSKAGTDQNQYNESTFTMAANQLATGEKGTWSVVSVTPATSATPVITDPHSYNTTVTGVEVGTSVVMKWTVTTSLGVCDPAESTVTLRNIDGTDLTLKTEFSENEICAYQSPTYTVTIVNNSQEIARSVEVANAIVNATFKVASVEVSAGSYDADSKVWKVGDIPSGATVTMSIEVKPTTTDAETTINGKSHVSSVNGIKYPLYEDATASLKSKSDVVSHAVPAIIDADVTVTNNNSCDDNNLTGKIEVAPGFDEYSFDGGNTWEPSNKRTNIKSGTYNVMVRNEHQCKSNQIDATVDNNAVTPTKFTVSTSGDGSYCEGEQSDVHLELSGSQQGFKYQVIQVIDETEASIGNPVDGTGSAIDFGVFGAGKYFVKAISNISTTCDLLMNDDVVEIVENPKPTMTYKVVDKATGSEIVAPYVITCLVPEMEIQLDGANGYVWSDQSTAATRVVNTSFKQSVYPVSDKGCTSDEVKFDIDVNKETPVITLSLEEGTLTCVEPELQVSVSENSGLTTVSYLWSNGSTDATQIFTTADTYSVVATNDENNCTSEAQIIVAENKQMPTVDIKQQNAICMPATVDIAEAVLPTSKYEAIYYYDDATSTTPMASTTVDVTDSKSFYVKAVGIEGNGCETDMLPIMVEKRGISDTPTVTPYNECPVDGKKSMKDLVKSDKAALRFFDDPDGTNEVSDMFDTSVENSSSTYYVSNTATGFCESELAEVSINIDGTIDFDLLASADEVTAASEELTLTATPTKDAEISKFSWIKNGTAMESTDSEITEILFTNSKFEVTGIGRCNTVTKDVTVRALWPTVIIPDGPGKNDEFARDCQITVFNRFNEKVFEGKDGWDGTLNCTFAKKGVKADPGVYYYYIVTPDGSSQKGTIEVVKF